MTKSSQAGTVILVLFGAVFAGFGIFGATSFLTADPTRVKGNPLAGVLICGIFIFIGLAIMLGAVVGGRKLRAQKARQESTPDSPWLWRDDWAQSRAESKSRNSAVGLWIIAILADIVSIAIVLIALPQYRESPDSKLLFLLLGFGLFGLIFTAVAVRATIRRERFGKTYFEFASLPFSPGKVLKGMIHLRFPTEAQHGIDLSLSCVREVVTGSGNNRSTQKIVLWQQSKNVPGQSLVTGPMGDAVIPVELAIPNDAYETNHDQLSDQVLWLLQAKADVPGVDYADEFEVPVFRLTPMASAETSEVFSNERDTAANAPAFVSDSGDVAPPENPKVVVSTGFQGGTEFYFPPFRNPAMVGILLAVTTILGVLVYFLHHSNAPGIFSILFGLFHLLLVLGLIHVALGSFRIEAGGDRLIVRRAVFGLGRSREYLFSDIAQLLVVQSGQTTNSSATSYSIRLQTKTGNKVTLADNITNRQEARWVVAQLEKFAGLKVDTHVAVEMVGISTAPPQRGQSYGSRTSARSTPATIAVGLAFFMAWIGFAAFMIMHKRPASNRAVRRSTAAQRTPVQRVKYAPFTDRDEERLQTLPEQAQAEELLERAIQHDARALNLFEENIGVWLGDIKLTDRMKQLEWRSRFSSDLRVRYANADLNLAMDGWAKTGQSAELLIERARTDTKYRQAAMYFMGMLAGRGVRYNEIYPTLVEYATKDSDANVRLWAVEGMRYLGTDEALNELFEIFTHDSSNAVRNRAGCNISDCGNFMRKQRMRMVPRLIALADDEHTSGQMRAWSFMALSEITDESLPSTASAWQDWYAHHGADKAEEFEQMDWWKVRGDE